MRGKRSYRVLRKFLLQASEEVETKGLRLAERVFIPENFSRHRMGEITRRREAALSILLSSDADAHFKMMIAIGGVKAFTVTTLGYTLRLKHLPERAFFLDHKTGGRTKRAFAAELLAWNAGLVKLVVGCLFHAQQEHLYQVDTLTLMMTSDEWIPLDHAYEKDLVDRLVREQRTFIKPLRYEAKHPGKFPNFQLLDAGERPVALDIVSAFLTPHERAAKASAIAARKPNGWVRDMAQSAVLLDLPKAMQRPAPGAATAAKTLVSSTA